MKKWYQTSLLVLLICIVTLSVSFSKYQNPFNSNHEGHIGYLNPTNPDASSNFKRCSDKLPIGFYHSSASNIYKGGKPTFRKLIESSFSKEKYNDSGFLNFRFLIDCNGNIGDIETNELDVDLNPTKLDSNLVQELYKLSFIKENWNLVEAKEPRDMYMYLIYKIEDGKVVEIIP
ncbi:hypothetical protein [Maribacter aestuarii]|uniref:hypothetical protein n=1 Tax=Maribacter aestuarii TaxID=1130723 RepID=UPI00248ADBCF|nr:hypothetical protein [Maribacter aestuarii]